MPDQNTQNTISAEGKKIFFLFPHSVIRDEMLDMLIMAGFETYTIVDATRATRLLAKFPGSIIYINIDEHFKEKDWEAYIRHLMSDPKTSECRVGIMSYNQDSALMQKYLMDIGIHCGYIQLKLGIQASTKIILDALTAAEAKGRRKFIRAECEDDPNATMNYKSRDGIFQGKILDISSAGIAARIPKLGDPPPNTVLKEVQLKLRSSLVLCDVVVMGRRRGDKDVYILIFDLSRMTQDSKLAIHHYIKQCLQKYIDTVHV